MIKTGSDFSGVGAFNQALDRLGINHDELFACDMDKYARQTFIYNFGEPKYYPENVYDREIPAESLDIYMTSPPCQSFSLAGKRKGEDSTNGVLFYNSHEFIKKNNPRFFIFENVKGLLSDDNGKTFQKWIDLLGGKSVNGNPVIFPHDEATPYHVYYQVMNAKNYGVPQNRERIFIIGIRDDADNEFSFPKPFHLVKRLKDVLETEVDEKYFLSDKMIASLTNKNNQDNGFTFNPKQGESIGNCVTARCFKMGADDNYVETLVSKEVRSEESKATRRETGTNNFRGKEIEFREQDFMNTITTSLTNDHFLKIGAIRGRNVSSEKIEQQLEINESGLCNSLTTVQKDNVVIYDLTNDFSENKTREYEEYSPSLRSERSGLATNFGCSKEEYTGIAVHPLSKKLEFTGFKDGNSPTLLATDYKAPKCIQFNSQRIRRLTPFECFRLMDFNENFKWNVSDSQAYKQAGNSIVVSCLIEIISKLKL